MSPREYGEVLHDADRARRRWEDSFKLEHAADVDELGAKAWLEMRDGWLDASRRLLVLGGMDPALAENTVAEWLRDLDR